MPVPGPIPTEARCILIISLPESSLQASQTWDSGVQPLWLLPSALPFVSADNHIQHLAFQRWAHRSQLGLMDHMDLLLNTHSDPTLQCWQCCHFTIPVGYSGTNHMWNLAPSDTGLSRTSGYQWFCFHRQLPPPVLLLSPGYMCSALVTTLHSTCVLTRWSFFIWLNSMRAEISFVFLLIVSPAPSTT